MARQLSTFFLVLLSLSALLVEGTQSHNNNHARLIRKRAAVSPIANAGAAPTLPLTVPAAIVGAGADPNQQGTALNTPTASSIDPAQTATSAAGQPSGGLLGGVTSLVDSILTGGSSSTASSSTPSSSSQSSSSSISSSSASSVAPSSASTPVTTAAVVSTPSSIPDTVVTVTSGTNVPATTGASANATTNAATSVNSSTHLARTTIVVIASVAGGIALIAIVWTVIRKWKFRPSDDFEERLNPISWDPTVDTSGPGMLQRTTSRASVGNRSFVSGGSHQATPPSLIADLPNHDFTAGGGGGLAPVGGYADMRRGPSPTPGALIPGSMESVMRGGQGGGPYDYGRQYSGGY